MKVSIQLLKVRLVWKFQYVKQASLLAGGRDVQVKQPLGEVHIFEFETVKDIAVLQPYSFCGKTRSDIGEQTSDSDKAPALPMCPKCEAAWKADPRSPWAAWSRGKGIKVDG